jgi:DNA polymerase
VNVATLLDELARQDIRLSVDAGSLAIDAPRGLLTEDLKSKIRYLKPKILARLRALAEPVISVDFETVSARDLRKTNGRVYARDPSTRVVCAVFILPDDRVIAWTPDHPEPEEVLDLVRHGVPLAAHNAHGFDAHIWARLGWPEPSAWIDTQPLAQVLGLPAKLENLAIAARLETRKDLDGQQLAVDLNRRASRQLAFTQTAETPEERKRLVAYCIADAQMVAELLETTLPAARLIEPEVREVHALINRRGVAFDVKAAEALIACEKRLAERALANAGVEASLPASTKRLREELATMGVAVSNVRRSTLLALLDDSETSEAVRALLQARLAISGINGHKCAAALARVESDGRLRDSLLYCGAHTGRWAGRGLQPQNLPKGVEFPQHFSGDLREDFIERALDAAVAGDLAALHELASSIESDVFKLLGTLVRACLHAPPGRVLGVVDYASIEACGLAWLAEDRATLEQFENRVDRYKEMAAKLFNVEKEFVNKAQRAVGKVVELGCGYQMGARRLGIYGAAQGVDWPAIGVTPDEAVEGWRDAHETVAGPVVERAGGGMHREGGLWRRMQDAALEAARGGRAMLGPLVWERRGGDVRCILPSGRPLVYRNAKVEWTPKPWGHYAMTYELRGRRVPTFGGKLVENVVQAVCRDLLAEALVRLDKAHFVTVLHVHDEVLCELDDPADLDAMASVMREVPAWARGMPIQAAGHTGRRYRK